jgi:hypothetical protein
LQGQGQDEEDNPQGHGAARGAVDAVRAMGGRPVSGAFPVRAAGKKSVSVKKSVDKFFLRA